MMTSHFINPFFHPSGPFLLKNLLEDIKDMVGAKIENPPDKEIFGIAGLAEAQDGDITFCHQGRNGDTCKKTKAGAVLVTADLQDFVPSSAIAVVVKDPLLAYGLIGAKFYPRKVATQHDIHPTAIIAASAKIAEPVMIAPHVVIGERVVIGKRTIIHANSVIGDDVVIGDDNIIADNCSISHTIMGNGCDIDAGVRIGGRGFGLTQYQGRILRVPQIGKVMIGNHVGISCNSVIDRGTVGDTIIKDYSQLDNVVVVGHNSQIDNSAVVCSMVGLAGSVHIGAGAMLGGQAGVADHIKVGAGAMVAAQGGVIQHLPKGAKVGGMPSMNHRQFLKSYHFLKNIDYQISKAHKKKNSS